MPGPSGLVIYEPCSAPNLRGGSQGSVIVWPSVAAGPDINLHHARDRCAPSHNNQGAGLTLIRLPQRKALPPFGASHAVLHVEDRAAAVRLKNVVLGELFELGS
jgi:hypothetical protein